MVMKTAFPSLILFDHLILISLPMAKSDSGDARLTWSVPAVPFTAAVDCVDLYDPAAAFGDVPIAAASSTSPLSADLRNPKGPLVACSSSTVFRMRSESSERCLVGRLLLCVWPDLLLPGEGELFPGKSELFPGILELLFKLLAAAAAAFDLSGSGGSEEARASHSLADTVRCLEARAVPEVGLGLC